MDRVRKGIVPPSLKRGSDASPRISKIEGPVASGSGFTRAGDVFASALGVDLLALIEDCAQIAAAEASASLFSGGPSCFL